MELCRTSDKRGRRTKRMGEGLPRFVSPLFSGLFQGVCLSSYLLCRDTHRGRSQCPRIDFNLHKPGRGIYNITNHSSHSAHMHTKLFVHYFSLASLQPSSGFLQVTMQLWPQVTSIQSNHAKRKTTAGTLASSRVVSLKNARR